MTLTIEKIREAELEPVRKWFQPDITVLEIGGGHGFQAGRIRASGCRVLSVDVAWPEGRTYYPVAIYDGVDFPTPDACFDLVYSSNVLEHVKDLPRLLASVRRVLKPAGVAIHGLPTTSWRWWTNLSHYPYLMKYVFGRHRPDAPVHAVADCYERKGIAYMFRRALIAGAHGEYSSAISEMYYYSAFRWRRVFRENGFDITAEMPAGLFYTGNAIFPNVSAERRRQLARIAGSSTRIYIMRTAE